MYPDVLRTINDNSVPIEGEMSIVPISTKTIRTQNEFLDGSVKNVRFDTNRIDVDLMIKTNSAEDLMNIQSLQRADKFKFKPSNYLRLHSTLSLTSFFDISMIYTAQVLSEITYEAMGGNIRDGLMMVVFRVRFFDSEPDPDHIENYFVYYDKILEYNNYIYSQEYRNQIQVIYS